MQTLNNVPQLDLNLQTCLAIIIERTKQENSKTLHTFNKGNTSQRTYNRLCKVKIPYKTRIETLRNRESNMIFDQI